MAFTNSLARSVMSPQNGFYELVNTFCHVAPELINRSIVPHVELTIQCIRPRILSIYSAYPKYNFVINCM